MKKRLLLVAAGAIGVLVYREWKRSEQSKQVWDQATDSVDEPDATN